MESRPSKIGQGRDMISALPDELLLGIIERLVLREAVRAGAVSTRWRHLPHQLSRLHLNAGNFQGTTPQEIMDAFTGATQRLLSACPLLAEKECKCDCRSTRAVKTLRLDFYVSAPHLSSIATKLEDTLSRGETERFVLDLYPPSSDLIPARHAARVAEFGQQFMSFSRASRVAFRWLTDLFLTSLMFGDSDVSSLIGACDKLRLLSIESCRLIKHSVLKIDAPNSAIQKLVFISFKCTRIDLDSVPKLTRLWCESRHSEKTPLRFGYVPELRKVRLGSQGMAWQTPFALSECFSRNTRNLSNLHLCFNFQMIWILPEHPKQLGAIFSNLTDVGLWHIFPECDLTWTLFILEAAPALQNFIVNRKRHSCFQTPEGSAVKTNVLWEPSKDLKHLNLKVLLMSGGFEEEDMVTNYIRLVMKLAVGLKTIKLRCHPCEQCNNAMDLESRRRFRADDASMHRVRDRLTHGSSSSVEIIICSRIWSRNDNNLVNEVFTATT